MTYFDDAIEPNLCRDPFRFAARSQEKHVRECAARGVWPTSHGDINISEMSEEYIHNCLALMKRKNRVAMLKLFGPVFHAELERRARAKEVQQ